MSIDELLRELRKVAPADLDEWKQLRAKQISALSAADQLRLRVDDVEKQLRDSVDQQSRTTRR